MVETLFGSMEPEEKGREEREALEKEKEKKRLESQASFLGVMKSESVKVVVGLIEKKLMERIDELIDKDPEAMMCIKILNELGVQKGFAEQAANKLEELYLKTDQ